jgi:hypothetical protein
MLSLLLFSMVTLPQNFLDKLETLKISQTSRVIVVTANTQKMTLFEEGKALAEYSISTARNGLGEKVNSYQTPLGLHQIKEKIGKDHPIGAVFESRIFKGEMWKPAAISALTTNETLSVSESKEEVEKSDLITTRILWLEGLEPGFNAGRNAEDALVDSYQRYIYIHGSNHEVDIGKPVSLGCIRMMNADVIEFFNQVQEGDLIWIQP